MKYKNIIIILIILITITGCNKTNNMKYQTITNEEVELLKNDQEYVIIDVRTIHEYKDGHIKNSINIPVDKIDSVLDAIKDKKQKIIVYCRSGGRSKKASDRLLELGYTNIYDMTNGIITWEYELEEN